MRIRPVALSFLLLPAVAGAQSAQALFDRYSGAVVVVVAGSGGSGGAVSVGSGAILTRTGLILTSYRQLTDGDRPAARIRVFFKPGRLSGTLGQDLRGGQDARLLATDPARDLALLKVPAEAIHVTPLRLTRDRAAAGDRPVLVASPEEGGPWSLATPAVLSRQADYQGLAGNHVYLLDAPARSGGAGGILIDPKGCLLGVGRMGDPAMKGQVAAANDAVVDFLAHARDPRAAVRRVSPLRASGPSAAPASAPAPAAAPQDLAEQDRKLDELDQLLPGAGNSAPTSAPAAPMAGGDPPVAAMPAPAAAPAGSPAGPGYLTPLRPYRSADASALLIAAVPEAAPAPMAQPVAPVAPTPPTPPVPAAAEPAAVPAVSVPFRSVEEAVFQGEFQAALDLAQGNPAGAPLVPALSQFVAAGKLAARSQWGAARYHFGQAGTSPRLARLAKYWQGIMLRRQGLTAAADQWFADNDLKEGQRP